MLEACEKNMKGGGAAGYLWNRNCEEINRKEVETELGGTWD